MWLHLGPKEGLYCMGETEGLPLVQYLWVGSVPFLLLEVGGEVSKKLLPVPRSMCTDSWGLYFTYCRELCDELDSRR